MNSFIFDALVTVLLYLPVAILVGLAWWAAHKGWKVTGGILWCLALLVLAILLAF
jgi:hypothetical protein